MIIINFALRTNSPFSRALNNVLNLFLNTMFRGRKQKELQGVGESEKNSKSI